MIINGLYTALMAPLVAARSAYFCGGGPTEVLGGGISGNHSFSLFLSEPDKVLERRLIDTVKSFDLVLAMGRRTIQFFRDHNADNRFEVVPLAIEREAGRFVDAPRVYDVIFIGRLSSVKRIDLFVKIIRELREHMPNVKAVIVGKGPLENPLKDLTLSLGVSDNILFAGYQTDIFEWLQKSKVFMLTSDSEGLSLALIEAMACGVPCVVPDVGELGELVNHGINGYLIQNHSIDDFSASVSSLLSDSLKLKQFSEAARCAARKYDLAESAKRWDQILMQI